MLRTRLLTVIIFIPVMVGFVALGGWPFTLFVAFLMAVAGWEFWRMFHQNGYSPSFFLTIAGIAGIIILRTAFGFQYSDVLLAFLVLAAMTMHVIQYERGSETSTFDFCITLGGILYLGWLGGYIVSLRNLPDGLWWLMTAIPSIGLADSAAFFVGRRIGRHKMVPRVSPKKSWEGYIGGVIIGTLGTVLIAALWNLCSPAVTPARGLVLGFVLTVLCPLGDLGESMIKRQFNIKDTSNFLPGHGGIMDRFDSWLWAAAISYYLITWLW
jgi:phosphatidate cytidylyltransferase